ncbi:MULTISPECIES: molybdopterin cofactor-binding domain-containing protein [unclassified Polynucleobacter]|uniref:xanthine dehydrogenase family protein molybdopterin-binding subunit n=1 Tax=unclassified Polynucleobacter TaxID=2640945 RepID=UPI001C20D1DF|nr:MULTISPECIES: molybdopterin cofactor-binding domain-containing protein [unclassified Polynucleobacter]
MKTSSNYLGKACERVEDTALLTGEGRYLDDLPLPVGTLYAAVVRSPIAHGKILSVDIGSALQLKGVRAILTIEDVQAWSNPLVVAVKTPMRQWVLANEYVRYVGEPIAVVIAESRALAEDGVERVALDIQPLPAVVDVDIALTDASIVLHKDIGSNCVLDRAYQYGDPDSAFQKAANIVEVDIRYPRNSCTPLETGGVVAQWRMADLSYEVTSNFMGPFSLHVVMAAALKVPGTKLRHHVAPDSGGSFGVKQSVLPYIIMSCLASRKAGAPVKFIEDRLEHLQAATSATSRHTHLRAAVDGEGKILALDYDQIEDCGAYLRAPEPATLYRMHGCVTGPYQIQNLKIRNRVVLINKTPTGLVRGFGGPQVYYALERLIHKIAKSLGKTHQEIAALNYVQKEQFPYRAAAGALLDSGDYQKALKTLEGSPEFKKILDRREQAKKEGRYYGIGIASIVEPSVSNMGYITTVLTKEQRAKAGPKNGAITSATVSVDPSGNIAANIASAPAGQGHQTVISQLLADVFGVLPSQIQVNVDFDTAKDAWSIAAGNYSSRFAGAVAGTVFLAAEKLKARIADYAAHVLKVKPDQLIFANGNISVVGGDERGIPFSRVCGNFHWSPGLIQEALGSEAILALQETQFWSAAVLEAPDEGDRINTSAAYGFALDACGIEIDPETCSAKIDQYITVHDAGKILNPALANGQIYGAYAQAVGAALFEEFVYSSDGNFLSGTFADYRLPTASDIGVPKIYHQESPSPFTPLGAKGIGEGNSMSTPVCIANAIADALDIENIILPATPSRIHALLVEKGSLKLDKSSSQVSSMTANTDYPLKAQGEVRLHVLQEEIFAVLLDPERLKNVIPGCESIHKKTITDGIQFDCVAVVRIGIAKARFEAKVVLTNVQSPDSFTLGGEGRGPLGMALGMGQVSLKKDNGVTVLSYDYQAQVSGKLAAIGSRLLEGAIRLVLDQLFRALAKEAGAKQEGLFKSLIGRLFALLGVSK